jgi:hypothetical protein
MQSSRFEHMVKGWHRGRQEYFCAAALDTHSGFWIRKKTSQAATLIFPYPARDVEIPLECPAGAPAGAIWSVAIRASARNRAPEPVMIGATIPGLSGELDASMSPPPPVEAPRIYVEGREDRNPLARDFEPESDGMSWDLVVDLERAPGTARLDFDLSEIPPGMNLTLLDLGSGGRVDLRDTPRLFLEDRGTQRRFRVLAGRGKVDPGPPRPEGDLIRAFPNPFTERVDFESSAGVEGRPLRLDIYDLQGHRVRTLETESSTTLTWDGRNGEGERVPGGVFFVRYELAGMRGLLRVTRLN